MTALDAAVVLTLATMIVGSYVFAWRCSNHAMEVVRGLTEAFTTLQVSLADRLGRIEERLGIEQQKKKR